jgi:hypothetical protein
MISDLNKKYKDKEIDFLTYTNSLVDLQKGIDKKDSALMTRRNLMIKIAQESLMTAASKLRAVPKDPKKTKAEEEDGMNKFLMRKIGKNYGG